MSDESEIIQRLTKAMREADEIFDGLSTRRYVRDCLLPILRGHGLELRLQSEALYGGAARNWREIIYRRAHLMPGQEITTEQRMILLQSACEPGCPTHQDADYYVRVAARRLTLLERYEHQNGHHDKEMRHTCADCYPEVAAERSALPAGKN